MPAFGIGRTNAKRHALRCCMCGLPFQSARPEAVTDTNKCRSALRRWRAIYGAAPVNPPGEGIIRPSWHNRDAFYRAYVDLPAFEQFKKQKAAGKAAKRKSGPK